MRYYAIPLAVDNFYSFTLYSIGYKVASITLTTQNVETGLPTGGMAMATEYKIVTTSTVGNLVNEVNNLLKTGWEPQGGLVVVALPDTQFGWSQALIKRS
jgi:hypothetical protein